MLATTPIFLDSQKLIYCFTSLCRFEPKTETQLTSVCKIWNQVMMHIISCNEKSKIDTLLKQIIRPLSKEVNRKYFSKLNIHELINDPADHPKFTTLKKLVFIFNALNKLPDQERILLQRTAPLNFFNTPFYYLTNNFTYTKKTTDKKVTTDIDLLNAPFFTQHEKKMVFQITFDPLFKDIKTLDTHAITTKADTIPYTEQTFLEYLAKTGEGCIKQEEYTGAEFILQLLLSHIKKARCCNAKHEDIRIEYQDLLFAKKGISLLKQGKSNNWQAAKKCNYEIQSKVNRENNLFDLCQTCLDLGLKSDNALGFAAYISNVTLSDKALYLIFNYRIEKENGYRLDQIITLVWSINQKEEMRFLRDNFRVSTDDTGIIDLIENSIKEGKFEAALTSINLLHQPECYSGFWTALASLLAENILQNHTNAFFLLEVILQIQFEKIQQQLLNKIIQHLRDHKLPVIALNFANALSNLQERRFALGWVLKDLGFSEEDYDMFIEMVMPISDRNERLIALKEMLGL